MPTISEIRQQYPQYQDMSDADLARALHGRYYRDMPLNEFNAKIGFTPNKVEDVAKSTGAGAARGAADLVGLPGTIRDAMQGGGEWLLRKGYELATGEQPSAQGGTVERFFAGPTDEVRQAIAPVSGIGSGSQLRESMSDVTDGATDYQPLTTEGEYGRTIGEFAPAAVSGPGGIARKVAMATVPAVASETAGQFTKGTALEPWARAGAAVAAGIPTAGINRPVAEAAKGAPTREALKAQTDRLYEGLRKAGIKYDANTFARTVQQTRDELLSKGLRPVGPVKEAFDYLDDFSRGAGLSPDFNDINAAVQAVGRSARSTQDGNARLAFNIIRDKLDDFERTAPLITNRPIAQETLNRARSTARQYALRNIKQRVLDEIAENAETYRAGTEAGIRNGIGNLLRSKKGKSLFTGAERTALLRVQQGRKPLEQLSKFGFDLSTGSGNAAFLPTLSSAGAIYAGGPLGALLPAAGTAAKAISPRLTSGALEQAGAAIRSGGLQGATGQQTQRAMIDQIIRHRMLAPMAIEGYRVPSSR